MAPHYLMALDAGGGGGHCLLLDPDSGATVRAARSWTHPTAPGTAGLGTDLDLEAIWAALSAAAQAALRDAAAGPDAVLGIAVTSMRHATVLLDAAGAPLLATPNRDSRAVTEAFQLAAEGGDAYYARTGHWPSPLSTAARLRWLATCQPAIWERAATVLSLSDWVTYRLCGERASDPSQAAETALFDVARREWARDLAAQLAIPERLLPPLLASGARIAALSAAAAAALGLRPGIPVAAGGADTQCGLLGAGIVHPGEAAVIAGTTVPTQLVLDQPCIDAQQRLWTGCHVVPGLWVLESNAGAMGEALDWLAQLLYGDAPAATARLLAEAGRSVPGAAGILSTFGTDVMNARALRLPTGTLTLSHLTTGHDPQRRRHLVRAVVEGMACALRANIDQLREVAGREITRVALAGGLSRSDIFADLLSAVLDAPVTVGATRDATALGAALCAGVGAGIFRDLVEAAAQMCRDVRVSHPDASRAQTYSDLYRGWQALRTAAAPAEAVAAQLMIPTVLQAMAASASTAAPVVRPRILVTADMDATALAQLRRLGDVTYASFREAMRLLSGPTLIEALQNIDVFITEVDVVDAASLAQLPALRAVVACRGDAVNVDRAACSAFGIPVLYAPGRNAGAVADLTIAFLLLLARRMPAATAFLHQPGIEAGDMGRMGQAFTTLQGRELWHKTVGLIGFGAVGRAVAQRLAPFGARVLVYDPFVTADDALLAGAELVGIDALLAASDFVSLHAAVTPDTRNLIGRAALARMQRGACLVNTARAALVDETALADALRSGQVRGAALDVFSVEPPGSDHPLLALENVIATPHIGGNTVEVAAHQGQLVADDLRRLCCGERPQHVLNPEVLDRFDWQAPRVQPAPDVLAGLAAAPPPAVSDLQQQHRTPPPAAPVPSSAAAGEAHQRMQRILSGFVDRLRDDAALRRFATGKDVTLHFTLTDLALGFYFRLRAGAVSGALGAPDTPADVELKMRAAIFDGMFTGTVNPMQAATTGRLAFAGDTVKAMTLQHIQADLSRLYSAARAAAGGPGDLPLEAPEPSRDTGATVAPPVTASDVRLELVQVVNELYAAELITATGGNVSVRIPGADTQLWITPSQLFKGHLRPDILVRIDGSGRTLDANTLSPSSERLMHCAIYRVRPEAQAIVHAHAPHITILANTGLPFLPISTEAAFFAELPRVPFLMPGSEALADAVAAGMGRSWAVVMQNHGLVVAGRSLRRAADMVEIIERTAEILVGCYALNIPPSTLPDDVVRTLQQMGDLMA